MPTYLLDTNMYRFIADDLYGVNERLLLVPPERVFLSGLVVVEAIVNGWAKELGRIETDKRRSNKELEELYQDLIDELRFLGRFNIKPYSDQAEAKYQEIFKKVRRDKLDCKMAAHAIVSDMTLVTDNTVDFQTIRDEFPDLRFENWATRQSA